MGKKDASGIKSAPVDQYRKQIGKQDYKKSKKELKGMKDKSDMKKSAMGIKDVVIMLGAFLLTVAAVYLILYVSISKEKDKAKQRL